MVLFGPGGQARLLLHNQVVALRLWESIGNGPVDRAMGLVGAKGASSNP